jgi:hypothetical protein
MEIVTRLMFEREQGQGIPQGHRSFVFQGQTMRAGILSPKADDRHHSPKPKNPRPASLLSVL